MNVVEIYACGGWVRDYDLTIFLHNVAVAGALCAAWEEGLLAGLDQVVYRDRMR